MRWPNAAGVGWRLCEAVSLARGCSRIKTADWVIDLGPEGGDDGCTIVAQGTPEQVAQVSASYTGHYLASVLGIPRANAS